MTDPLPYPNGAEQIEQYSPDLTALRAVDAALRSQSDFNRLVQRRRFLSNQLRVKANELDTETNLMLEEYGEINPIPADYEPVMPTPKHPRQDGVNQSGAHMPSSFAEASLLAARDELDRREKELIAHRDHLLQREKELDERLGQAEALEHKAQRKK